MYIIFVLSFVRCSENTVTPNHLPCILFGKRFFQIFLHCFQISADLPIIIKLRYNNFWKICANWSTTSRKSDYSTEYELLKYTDYVDRFKDFIKKYPTVTIEATCKAESDL